MLSARLSMPEFPGQGKAHHGGAGPVALDSLFRASLRSSVIA